LRSSEKYPKKNKLKSTKSQEKIPSLYPNKTIAKSSTIQSLNTTLTKLHQNLKKSAKQHLKSSSYSRSKQGLNTSLSGNFKDLKYLVRKIGTEAKFKV